MSRTRMKQITVRNDEIFLNKSLTIIKSVKSS